LKNTIRIIPTRNTAQKFDILSAVARYRILTHIGVISINPVLVATNVRSKSLQCLHPGFDLRVGEGGVLLAFDHNGDGQDKPVVRLAVKSHDVVDALRC